MQRNIKCLLLSWRTLELHLKNQTTVCSQCISYVEVLQDTLSRETSTQDLHTGTQHV